MNIMPPTETTHLLLRPLTPADLGLITPMLQNPKVMYAWEHAFSEEEVQDWLHRNIARYGEVGYGYYAAVERSTGQLAGQIGLLPETINGAERLGIGYLLDEPFWGKGYATEGAAACAQYAFEELGAPDVLCDIRPENTGSISVAKRLGMTRIGSSVKHYYGKDMVHDLYVLTKGEWEQSRRTEGTQDES